MVSYDGKGAKTVELYKLSYWSVAADFQEPLMEDLSLFRSAKSPGDQFDGNFVR